MRAWLGWIAIGWLLALCAVALMAYGGSSHRMTLEEQTRAIAQDLRCLVCQGESVADSPSIFSRSVRGVIKQRLARGESPDQIKAFLRSRYSDSIELAPPRSGIGTVAWLAPPLLLLGGVGLLLTLVTDWRTKGRTR